MSLDVAAPYGYTPPQITPVAKGPIVSPPADTTPVELPHTPIEPSTCGCGTKCSCDANGPSQNCGCKGVCQCGQHKPIPPTPSPKPACGCGSNCGCEANVPTKNCGCKKPCGCGKETISTFDQVIAALQALLASIRPKNA